MWKNSHGDLASSVTQVYAVDFPEATRVTRSVCYCETPHVLRSPIFSWGKGAACKTKESRDTNFLSLMITVMHDIHVRNVSRLCRTFTHVTFIDTEQCFPNLFSN